MHNIPFYVTLESELSVDLAEIYTADTGFACTMLGRSSRRDIRRNTLGIEYVPLSSSLPRTVAHELVPLGAGT
jgi:hypothetical protein